ncbi:MAB_1171c family putative transporter [Pseudokineococcus sp. 1T1Z-3]|uniref:MAB_1171c family putative transporter n=1 Tax=Pseudokineococcus sp. 1T1Z-3 TaxID=3132745 RepID=UPI003098E728
MTAVSVTVAVALWTAVVLRAPGAKKNHRRRMLWFTLLSLALVATFDLPFVLDGIGSLTPAAHNVGHLLKYLAAVMAAAGAHEIVRGGYLPPGRAEVGFGARVAITGGVLAVLVALFVVAPIHTEQVDSLTAAYAGLPTIRAFLVLFLAALSTLLVGVVRHTAWYRRQLPPGPLRTSMTMILAAAVAGLLFALLKVLVVASTPMIPRGAAALTVSPVSTGLLATSLLLFAVGTAWHALQNLTPGRYLIALHRDRQLRRLWRDLRDVVPTISLEDALARRSDTDGHEAGHRRMPVGRHEVELRYWRRVMEILDGELTLRPYVVPSLRGAAEEAARRRGVAAVDVAPVAERAVLEVARRRRTRGEAPVPGRAAPRTPPLSSFDVEARRLHAMAAHRADALDLADHLDHDTSATIAS